jgi:hypothetical protein
MRGEAGASQGLLREKGNMRSITKATLRTFAGLAAAAALVAGGAGVASAATVSPAAHTGASWVGQGCSYRALEHWNLNGHNKVEAVYQGTTYTYSVTFRQFGSCLSGTLTDSYYPTTGPIFGTVVRNHVVFTFRYPSGSVQGARTFSGYINRWGGVSGNWWETGSEQGTGTFTLARHAAPACFWWEWWYHNSGCPVYPW